MTFYFLLLVPVLPLPLLKNPKPTRVLRTNITQVDLVPEQTRVLVRVDALTVEFF